MRRTMSMGFALVAALAASGCTSSPPPSIAHVHVGHALDGWADAPDRRGLLATAEGEARVAVEHAGYAVAGAADIPALKAHIGHVLHAVEPKAIADGPGLGYGLTRAAGDAAKHMRFAAASRDVSGNLRAALPGLADQADAVASKGAVVAELARQVLASRGAEEAVALAIEVQAISATNAQALADLRTGLQAAVAREAPPYATIESRWLFGLVPLPSGEWTFRDQASSPSRY